MEILSTNLFNKEIIKFPEVEVDFSAIDRAMKEKRSQDLIDLGVAHIMFDRLVVQIKNFESTLTDNEETGAYLDSFGTKVLVLIDKIGYHDPYFIVFDGVNAENNQRVRLIQHTTQISVLLVAMKFEDNRPAKRIGFYIETNDKDNSSAGQDQ